MALNLTLGPNALKISKAQQMTILEVLGASLIVGAAFVLSIWLVRYIAFNADVIAAKSESVDNYMASVINTGVCDDTNGDGNLNDAELADCDPDNVSLSAIPNTLRSNILVNLANSSALESVQRSLSSDCYDSDGDAINYLRLYENATSDADRETYLSFYQTCSALRTIPDALPSTLNTEAAMASLNYLFNLANVTPESMSPRGEEASASFGTDSLMTTTISFNVVENERTIMNLLETMESSIREYSFVSASFEVKDDGSIDLSAQVQAYYVTSTELQETNKTVRNTH